MRIPHEFLFLAMLWLCSVVRAQGMTACPGRIFVYCENSANLNAPATGADGLTLAQSWTAPIRGTMEFDLPANVQIGAVGLRIPATHTFTNP